MKHFFLLAILSSSLFTSLALAANPDQDLIVDLVRERFTASSPAKLADLQLGKTWNCVIYSGQRGIMPNYNTIRENFLFEKGTKENQVVNSQPFQYQIFDVTNNAIFSTVGDSQLHVRVAKNSALVFENIGPQPQNHKAYRSITDPKLRAIDYIYCK